MLKEQEAQRIAALDESLREVDSGMERINGFLGIAPDRFNSVLGFGALNILLLYGGKHRTYDMKQGYSTIPVRPPAYAWRYCQRVVF
jgi:hypothetical protein